MNERLAPRNWRGAVLPLIEVGLHASICGSPFASMIASARETYARLDDDPRPPEIGLWQDTFTLAVTDALSASDVRVTVDQTQLRDIVSDYLEETLDSTVGVTEQALRDPTTFTPYQNVRETFPHFVGRRFSSAFAVGDKAAALKLKLDAALKRALSVAWRSNTSRAQALAPLVHGPVAEGERQEAAWQKHNDWIRAGFYGADVFSFETLPQPVKLKDVYIFLRCVWHETVDGEDTADAPESNAEPGKRRRRIAHVAKLHEHMHAWLQSPTTSDTVRIVAGGPGTGKSSFARAFATEVTQRTG